MDEKMVALMKKLVADEIDYVQNGEYGESFTRLPTEAGFENTVLWDRRGNACGVDCRDKGCDFNLVELARKHGYADLHDMLEDVFDHVSVDYRFTSDMYYHCERNKVEWDYCAVSETEMQLDDYSSPELHTYILGLDDDGLREFSNECDCVIEFQGKGYRKPEDVLIDITIYIGGAIVVYSELDAVLEYLENKDK